MNNKGKFQLLSYLVNDYLIYYKSLNKNKKLVAFAMFETVIINPIINILNYFLSKRYLHYYAIQLNISEKTRNIFLLNFEEAKKETIIKFFNETYQKLVEENNTIYFLKNSKLESEFLGPILKNINSKVSLLKQNESILVLSNSDSFLLNFYCINLEYLENKDSFINNFIKIINNFDRKGFLIFNFKIDNNEEIEFSSYFIEKIIKNDDSFNTENNINNFFGCNVLKRKDLKIREIFSCLWRLGISNDFFHLKSLESLFKPKNQNDLSHLLEFNKLFEQNLIKSKIEYIRLSNNLTLIERKSLFLVLTRLDSEYIKKIIEKYNSNYFIYITIINKKEFKKLVEITNFKSLHNLMILDSDELSNFNFEIFKNK